MKFALIFLFGFAFGIGTLTLVGKRPNLDTSSLTVLRSDLLTLNHVSSKLLEHPEQSGLTFRGGDITPADAVCTNLECAIRFNR